MTDDLLPIYKALSVPEVAMLLEMYPDFDLPRHVPFSRQKMKAARLMKCRKHVLPDSEPEYDVAEVQAERVRRIPDVERVDAPVVVTEWISRLKHSKDAA